MEVWVVGNAAASTSSAISLHTVVLHSLSNIYWFAWLVFWTTWTPVFFSPPCFFKETDTLQNQNLSINRRSAAWPKNCSFLKPMRGSLDWHLSTNGCLAKSRLKKKKTETKESKWTLGGDKSATQLIFNLHIGSRHYQTHQHFTKSCINNLCLSLNLFWIKEFPTFFIKKHKILSFAAARTPDDYALRLHYKSQWSRKWCVCIEKLLILIKPPLYDDLKSWVPVVTYDFPTYFSGSFILSAASAATLPLICWLDECFQEPQQSRVQNKWDAFCAEQPC